MIEETIQALKTALSHEILICILVVTVLVFRLRASLVIASLLPLAVLATFIIMRIAGIDIGVVMVEAGAFDNGRIWHLFAVPMWAAFTGSITAGSIPAIDGVPSQT